MRKIKDKDLRGKKKYDVLLKIQRANEIKPMMDKKHPQLKKKKRISFKDLEKRGYI